MDDRSSFFHSRVHIKDSRQFLVFHPDEVQCFLGRIPVHRRNGRHFITDKSDLINRKRIFVLGIRDETPIAVFDLWRFFSGDHTSDPRKGLGFAHINVKDAGMGNWAS